MLLGFLVCVCLTLIYKKLIFNLFVDHQAVVQYMADYVAERENAKFQSLKKKKKKKGFWFWFCSKLCPIGRNSTKNKPVLV